MTVSHNAHEELTQSLIASIKHENEKNALLERKRYSAINNYLDAASMELRKGDALDDLILKKIMELQQLVQGQVIGYDDEWKERR